MKDYLGVAKRILGDTRYMASDEDFKKLADNISLLETRGLDELNERLIAARTHATIFNTIAEHNFAVILVSRHSPLIPISYEPAASSQRPPDFKVVIESITYWIQVKDLSKLERENRQDKLIQKIKEKAKEAKNGKFFSCTLSDDFKEDCVPVLINFLKEQAESAVDGSSVLFTSRNNQRAEITFYLPSKTELSELTLVCAGDLEILNITGLTRGQIKQSLLNAVGAFNWEVDENNINLIVMEADNKEDLDISDALFGAEYEIFNSMRGHLGWSRNEDGCFSNPDFSKKVAGVIAIKRKRERVDEISSLSPDEIVSRLSPQEREISEGMTPEEIKDALEWENSGPIADYSLILYMNDNHKHLVEKIKGLLSFDRIIYYNMKPPMGEGNFGC